jgi:hypothetical protein
MSTAASLGDDLVQLCRAGKNLEAIERLYADDITSVEAGEAPGVPRQMTGKPAIRGKNQWWIDNNDVHSTQVSGPYPHGKDRFAVHFRYDVTSKQNGKRAQMEEVGVYQVANGKVVREEFFSQAN